MTTTTQQSHSNNGNDYNNLWLEGCCFVNEIREVPGRQPYITLSISALKGKKADRESLYIRSANVTGSQAKQMVDALYALWLQSQEPGKKNAPFNVFARFRLGDLAVSTYPKTLDGGKIEHRASMQGRLLKLTHVHIDGKRMFEDLDELPDSGAKGDTQSAA
jgi:hypothetical protein